LKELFVDGKAVPTGGAGYFLTLAQLCALSPTVQKYVNTATRAHKTSTGEMKYTRQAELEDESTSDYGVYLLEVENEEDPSPCEVAEFRQVDTDERFRLIVRPNEKVEDMIPRPLIRQSFGTVADNTAAFLSVDTCCIKVTIGGVDTDLMIDDGSMINLIPYELFEMINEDSNVPMVQTKPFKMKGVTGQAETLMGFVTLEVTLAGIAAEHIFWVSGNIPKVILGMPGIWALRMDLIWSGERRVIRINTKKGQGHQYMHLRGGPNKTFYDARQRKRLHVSVEEFMVSSVDVRNVVEADTTVFSRDRTEYGCDGYGKCNCMPEEELERGEDSPGPVEGMGLPETDGDDLGIMEQIPEFCLSASVETVEDEEEVKEEVVVKVEDDSWAESIARNVAESMFADMEGEEERMVYAVEPQLSQVEKRKREESFTRKLEGEEQSMSAVEFDLETEEITYEVNGVYKPVAKKKRPVDTIYPEVEKTPLRVPEDLMEGIREVPRHPPSWEELRDGERVTKERWAPLMEGDF
jgi:hypothetical protein